MTTITAFGPASTADEVLDGVDLTGKRALVTGVSAGIGVETARSLAAHGAAVVGAVRDVDKAAMAMEKSFGRAGGLDLVELDLGSLASVRAAADALIEDGRPFDVVICNAGVMATPFGKTVDGFETQFGINHLGHFLFVNRIAPLLRSGARLVMVSSAGHRRADVDLDDPNFGRTPYDPLVAYGRSKTANILFAVEFDRRHSASDVTATAVHPGVILDTELGRHTPPGAAQAMMERLNTERWNAGLSLIFEKSVAQGAATSVWAGVVAPSADVGGRYCEDCHVAEVLDTGPNVLGGVRPHALNAETAKALWATSEAMVGERF